MTNEQKLQGIAEDVSLSAAGTAMPSMHIHINSSSPSAIQYSVTVESRRKYQRRSNRRSQLTMGIEPRGDIIATPSKHLDPSKLSGKIGAAMSTLTQIAAKVLANSPEVIEAEEVLAREVQSNDVQSYLDALQPLPKVSEDRVVLLARKAQKRNWLASSCNLVNQKAFMDIASGEFSSKDKNPSRTIGRLIKAHGVLVVEHGGSKQYPADQLAEESLQIYPEIPALLEDAFKKGYSEWDVLEWLGSEHRLEGAVTPGEPLDYGTIDDLLAQLKQTKNDAEPLPEYRPFTLLSNAEIELFNSLKKQWLRG